MHTFSRLSFALAGLMLAAQLSLGAEPPIELFATSDAIRVFEDGYACPPASAKELRLFGVRNETISGQCVVRARTNLEKLTVSAGPLTRDGGKSQIAADHVRWNLVSSIFIEKNTRKVSKADITRPAPARFPDCLTEDRECALAKDALKAVYLTVEIPRSAEPGEYRGAVTVTAGREKGCLPVVLKVYPLTLPDDRHVLVSEWLATNRFKQYHAVDSQQSDRFWQILRAYAKNMAEHRQNVFQVSIDLIENRLSADGKLHSDFAGFDRWAQVFWDTGRMDRLETGFVARFGKGGWSGSEVVLRDFSVKDEASGRSKRLPGKEFLPKFLPGLVKHLAEKKWLDRTVFHIADEPSNNNVMAWREAADFVHRCAPELRRIDAIETCHCLDRLEVWVPKLDHLSTWPSAFEDAQRRGNELWFYTVGIFQGGSTMNKTVDVPLIDTRLMHWLNYRYALKGYLHWGLNAWTADPWNAPGEHRGDGWHVYPKRDGVLDSLRWEQMRNGLQDCECLWLLENKIAQIKATLSPRVAELIEPRRRGVEIASRVVRSYTDYDRNPDTLYAARRQAIEETLALDAAPRVILQTNPPEHSTMANDCGVDVHGWAEPGTELKVNRQTVTVASDGLFLAHVRPSREGTIAVEAVGGKAHKTLQRQFRLQFPSPQPGKH